MPVFLDFVRIKTGIKYRISPPKLLHEKIIALWREETYGY